MLEGDLFLLSFTWFNVEVHWKREREREGGGEMEERMEREGEKQLNRREGIDRGKEQGKGGNKRGYE